MSQKKAKVDVDWKGFYEELQSESERGAVIIAGAVLDTVLRDLIAAFLVDDPKVVDEFLGTSDQPDRPLSSFSSRIKAAYSLGLISKAVYNDLNHIRQIRNNFAHQMHGYSFDEPEIISRCKAIYVAKIMTDALPHLPKTHRELFLYAVFQLATLLTVRTKKIERERRTVHPDPTFTVVRVTGDSPVGGERSEDS